MQNFQKTVLITGAAGFIGAALALHCLKRGWTVHGLDNLDGYYPSDIKRSRIRHIEEKVTDPNMGCGTFNFVVADCLDTESFYDNIPLKDVDLIIHLAAQPGVSASAHDPRPYIRNNLVAFMNVLEMSRMWKKPMLIASSSTVYGEGDSQNYAVDRIDLPLSVYGATKSVNEILARAYCKNYGMSVTAMRFFSIYGPWGRPDMFYYIIANKLLRGENITVFGDGSILRDMTFIDDAVSAIGILIDDSEWMTPGFRAWDIGFQNQISVSDMIHTIAVHLDLTPRIIYEASRDYDMLQTRASRQHSSFLARIEPVRPAQGLKMFTDWLVENGGVYDAYQTKA